MCGYGLSSLYEPAAGDAIPDEVPSVPSAPEDPTLLRNMVVHVKDARSAAGVLSKCTEAWQAHATLVLV
jgi:hypothetical protein